MVNSEKKVSGPTPTPTPSEKFSYPFVELINYMAYEIPITGSNVSADLTNETSGISSIEELRVINQSDSVDEFSVSLVIPQPAEEVVNEVNSFVNRYKKNKVMKVGEGDDDWNYSYFNLTEAIKIEGNSFVKVDLPKGLILNTVDRLFLTHRYNNCISTFCSQKLYLGYTVV